MAGFNLTQTDSGRLIKDVNDLEDADLDSDELGSVVLKPNGKLVRYQAYCEWREGLSWKCRLREIDVSHKYRPNMKVGCG